MAKRLSTWIVAADGARARFFSPSEDAKKLVAVGAADMVAPQSRQHSRDLKSDAGPQLQLVPRRRAPRVQPPHDYHSSRSTASRRSLQKP
jgi:hypothetical protein